MALVCCFPKPFDSLGGVLWDSFTPRIRSTKEGLCRGVSLVRRLAPPPDRLCRVLGNAPPIVVRHPQIELRLGISLRDGLLRTLAGASKKQDDHREPYRGS